MTNIELTIKTGPIVGTIQYKELKSEIRVLNYNLDGASESEAIAFIGSVINPNNKKLVFPAGK